MVTSRYTGMIVPAVAPIDVEIERAIVEAARTVAPLFELHQWKWAGRKEQFVPDEEEIARSLRSLVKQLYRDNLVRIATGRLIVERMDDAVVGFSLELGEFDERATEEEVP